LNGRGSWRFSVRPKGGEGSESKERIPAAHTKTHLEPRPKPKPKTKTAPRKHTKRRSKKASRAEIRRRFKHAADIEHVRYCVANPVVCGGANDLEVITGAIVAGAEELSAYSDARACYNERLGAVGACAWTFSGVITGGLGKLSKVLGKFDNVVRKACSFSGDTRVVMADGTTEPIADIKAGDKVLVADPETGERGARVVTHVWKHDDTLVGASDGGRGPS
jgi:hypothetical protein